MADENDEQSTGTAAATPDASTPAAANGKPNGGFPKPAAAATGPKKFTRPNAKSAKPSKKVAAKETKKVKDTKKKKAKVKREKKAAPKAERAARTSVNDDATIKVLASANPFREGTNRAKQFAKLKTGMTVAKAIAAGCSRRAIMRSAKRGQIKLSK